MTYDFGGEHFTVLRAAYGMFHGLTSNSAVANAILNNGINQVNFFFTPTTAGAPMYPNVLPSMPTVAGARPDLNYLRFRPGEAESAIVRPVDGARAAVRHDRVGDLHEQPRRAAAVLPRRQLQSRHRPGGVPGGGRPDGPIPVLSRGTAEPADFVRMIVMESTIATRYNALVLSATKRFVDGLMFNANYTLSKAEDNGQSSATFFGGNLPFDSLNYRTSGPDNTMFPSNNDRRHRFVGSFHYQPT